MGESGPPGARAKPAAVLARPDPVLTAHAIAQLVRDVQEGRRHPKELSAKERRAVVAMLADGTRPVRAIAAFLQTSHHVVSADLAKVRRTLGRQLIERWGVEGAVGFLETTAEECYQKALENGDVGLAWAIRSSFVKQLRELGALTPKGEQEGFKVTFESMGQGLARATEALERAFRPELSGERIVRLDRVLPLPDTLGGAPEGASQTFEVPQRSVDPAPGVVPTNGDLPNPSVPISKIEASGERYVIVRPRDES